MLGSGSKDTWHKNSLEQCINQHMNHENEHWLTCNKNTWNMVGKNTCHKNSWH